MTDEELVENAATALASFHRSACYPEADPIELEVAARSLVAVVLPIIERETLRRAASLVHDLGYYSESYIDPENRTRELEAHNYAIWEARDAIRALIPEQSK